MSKIIRLAGVNINDPANGLSITDTNIWDTPEKDIVLHKLAQRDGSIVTYQSYNPRMLHLNGWIQGISVDDFEQKLDNIKRYSSDYFVDLDLQYLGGFRTYKVSIEKMEVQRENMPDFATFQLKMIASNPFATGEVYTAPSQRVGSPSNAPKTASYTFYRNNSQNTSTAPILPIITLQVVDFQQTVSFDRVDTHIQIGNPNYDRFVKIFFNPNARGHTDILANDIFRVDCLHTQVTRNNQEIFVQGIMPSWSPSDSTAVLEISSNNDASWTFNVGVSFTHRYL